MGARVVSLAAGLRVHLVSFADGEFRARKSIFSRDAIASGFFDSVSVFELDDLPQGFRKRHGPFMTLAQRGFGYWIWKPVVILEALKKVPPGDVLVYLDAGFTLNANGRKRFTEYLELAQDSAFKMLSFQNVFTEAHWTKADLMQRLGIETSHSHCKTSQLTSGFIVLENTRSNLELLSEWSAIATEENYRYSDDTESSAGNHPLFQEHRHDQSISSLLRKERGTEMTYYEVKGSSEAFEKFKHTIPAWATRTRK